MDTGNIIAAFGPPPGDRTTLSKSCIATLDEIYRHPLSHNLEWVDVIALFSKLGSVEHKANNEFAFAIAGEHHLMHAVDGKNLPTDAVVGFRHMLMRAGWSVQTAKPNAVFLGVAPEDAPDLLVVVDHREAHIYQLDIAATDQTNHTIKPYDPHHFLHHVSHKDQSREHGHRVAEDTSFYARITEALRAAGRIVVVGHGERATPMPDVTWRPICGFTTQLCFRSCDCT